MNGLYVTVSIPLLLVLAGFNHAHGLTTFGKSNNQGTQNTPNTGTDYLQYLFSFFFFFSSTRSSISLHKQPSNHESHSPAGHPHCGALRYKWIHLITTCHSVCFQHTPSNAPTRPIAPSSRERLVLGDTVFAGTTPTLWTADVTLNIKVILHLLRTIFYLHDLAKRTTVVEVGVSGALRSWNRSIGNFFIETIIWWDMFSFFFFLHDNELFEMMQFYESYNYNFFKCLTIIVGNLMRQKNTYNQNLF